MIAQALLLLLLSPLPYYIRANCKRFPEVDQDAVKIQPLLNNRFSNGLPEVVSYAEVGQVVRRINRDSSKIPVFACNGLECERDPFDSQ